MVASVPTETVTRLARAEAALALAEGWRLPRKSLVAEAAGFSRKTFLGRENSRAMDAVFLELREKQSAMILAAAAELRDWGIVPSTYALADHLGIPERALSSSLSNSEGRFYDVLIQVGESRRRNGQFMRPVSVERKCKCGCIGRTDGARLINGYLPECWEECQYWIARDERMSA